MRPASVDSTSQTALHVLLVTHQAALFAALNTKDFSYQSYVKYTRYTCARLLSTRPARRRYMYS